MRQFIAVVLVCGALFSFASTAATPQQTSSLKQTAEKPRGNPDVKVWVNSNSGVYHCPGTRWYGNTKSGEYMTQKQAHEKGYRPAYGKACR
jgi:hypothetical protein